MPPPARHIRVTGCPSGRPSSCVPERAQALGLAGGTGGHAETGPGTETGRLAQLPSGHPGGTSLCFCIPEEMGMLLRHPRAVGEWARGGSWSFSPLCGLAGRNLAGGYQDRHGGSAGSSRGGKNGHTGNSALPCISVQAPFLLIFRQAASFSSITYTPHGCFHPTASPGTWPCSSHIQLRSETSAPAAPTWLQLKFPSNGG